MKVLITGGAGFIGTHLTRRLLASGHDITILDSFLPQVHGGNQDVAPDVKPHVRLVAGDVADPDRLGAALAGAECVVHLAAETGTGQSMYEVMRYERTNLSGTAALYEILAKDSKRSVERVVVASSRSIYGEGAYRCEIHGLVYPRPRPTAEKVAGLFDPVCPICGGPCALAPTPEEAPFQPSSFYGLTKQVQEQTVLMFGEVLGLTSVALRYQNVYGPGQSLQNPYTGILAIFSNLARERRLINVFEDGLESRDFVHVEDVVTATAACLNSGLTGRHAVNVGCGKKTTVLDVATQVNEFYGGGSEIKVTGAFREGDIRHCIADMTKAATLLNFQPKWEFSDGLRSFLEWANQSDPSSTGYEESLAEMRERGLLRG